MRIGNPSGGSRRGGTCLGLILILGFGILFVGGFFAWKWHKEDKAARSAFSQDPSLKETNEPRELEVVVTRDWETNHSEVREELPLPSLEPDQPSIIENRTGPDPRVLEPEPEEMPLTPPPPPGINTNPPPEMVPEETPATFRPRPVIDLFEAQLQLDRLGFSSGSIDGVNGGQTKAALLAFQQRERLPMTGVLDDQTRGKLILQRPALSRHVIRESEVEGLIPTPSSWLGKSRALRLGYETTLELLSEKSHSNPKLLKRLNPNMDWGQLKAGDIVVIPDAGRDTPSRRGAFIRIRLGSKTLQVLDERAQILAHFPCSIARKVEKRPQGEIKVEVLVEGPNYTFDPERFPNTPESRSGSGKLILPPGPNNPVGTTWIGLSLPGYGMHGTPEPEQVGRTESLGCFRLANWNAEYLLKMVSIGDSVFVVP